MLIQLDQHLSQQKLAGRAGVKLWDLLVEAGIKQDEATLLKFTAQDGYTITLTYKELFEISAICSLNLSRKSSRR